MSDHNKPPSTALSPDLDWSQIRETVRMLFLSVAQIEVAMSESDESVESLTGAFTSMVQNENEVAALVDQLPDSEATRAVREAILKNAKNVSNEMQSAIVAFQFYDKLSQRLSHVSDSIESLSDLVGDTVIIYNPVEWNALQKMIQSKYTMREEHDMFEYVMQGGDVREAVRNFTEKRKSTVVEQNDVEFF